MSKRSYAAKFAKDDVQRYAQNRPSICEEISTCLVDITAKMDKKHRNGCKGRTYLRTADAWIKRLSMCSLKDIEEIDRVQSDRVQVVGGFESTPRVLQSTRDDIVVDDALTFVDDVRIVDGGSTTSAHRVESEMGSEMSSEIPPTPAPRDACCGT